MKKKTTKKKTVKKNAKAKELSLLEQAELGHKLFVPFNNKIKKAVGDFHESCAKHPDPDIAFITGFHTCVKALNELYDKAIVKLNENR